MKNEQRSNTEINSKVISKAVLQDSLCLLIFDIDSSKLKAFSENTPNCIPNVNKEEIHINDIIEYENDLISSLTQRSFIIVEPEKNGNDYFALLTADFNNIYVHIEIKKSKQINEHKHIDFLGQTEILTHSKDISSLLDQFLVIIRKIIPFDALLIQQFDEHKNWQVVAADTLQQVPSYKNMFFPASDLPDHIHTMLEKGIPYLAYDLNSNYINILGSDPILLSYIISASPGDYNLLLWKNMGFESIAIFPIIINKKLWGTITGIHKSPFALSLEKVATVSYMSHFLSTQLQVKILQQGIEIEEKKNSFSDLRDILVNYTETEKAVQDNHEDIITLINASGISLFKEGKIFNFGITPPSFIIEEIKENLLDGLEKPFYETSNLAAEIPELHPYKNHVSGLAAVQISDNSKDFLVWYRPNNTKVIQWAGNPKINKNTKLPRTEFVPWIEVKTGLSVEWTSKDIFFIKETRKILTEIGRNQNQLIVDQEQAFKLIFQHSSDLIAILNQDLSVRYMSDAAETLFGTDFKEGKEKWEEMVHPEDLEKLKSYLQKVNSGETITIGVEYRIKNSTGNYVYLETFANNYLKNPLFKGILCNTRDITQKINALNSLSKFQRIVETTNSAVLIVDRQRAALPIIYTNQGIFHFTNRKREAVIGRSWQLISSYIAETQNTIAFKTAIKNGKAIETTLKIKIPGKDEIWVRAQLSPVEVHKDPKRDDLVIIFSDITAEVDAKEKLKEYTEKLHLSNEELQTFAYVASHDLQEPLRTISGFSELFAETYQDKIDEEANEYLAFILQATGRMKKLINDLLYFSRLSTEKGFIKEIDVTTTLGKATDNLHTLIEENKAIITYEILPSIFVNETLLLQVFQNLISNAIKYRSNKQPRIHITAKYQQQNWVFGVEDNGIGISKKYFERIFIIFQRLHTTDKYSGTGIGLAICKKIIEKYGGRIWVESEEGKGSTFYFTIPDILTLS